MNYTKIDIENWKRKDIYDFFINQRRIVVSLTVDIDVTKLVGFVKSNGYKFYPTMIWAVSQVINSHDEFKYGYNEQGELIKWDYVSPYYAEFHQEDESFSKILTEYTGDLASFHKAYLENKEKYASYRGFDLKIPPNFFDISCLPWVKYSHVDSHVFDEGKFLAPVIVWGKYEKSDGRLLMPLTMNIHHASADGFHICRFFNELQELIDNI